MKQFEGIGAVNYVFVGIMLAQVDGVNRPVSWPDGRIILALTPPHGG